MRILALLAASTIAAPLFAQTAPAQPAAPPAQAGDAGMEMKRPPVTLHIGEAAPTLGQATWTQGGPVATWEKGKFYVLDFWATWCAPCVASIPHMNEMHKKVAGQGGQVIGVAVWPQDGMQPTKQYVEAKGAEMSYPVAEDKEDAINKAFMEATGSDAIPTVMIVDQEGRLAWLGHPQQGLDKAVEQIAAGTFDIGAARKKAEAREKAEAILDEANGFAEEGKWDEVLARIDQVLALDYEPAFWALTKAQIMIAVAGKADAGYEFLAQSLTGALKDEPELLQRTAWFIAETPDLEKRDFALAEKAGTRALEIKGENDAMSLETLARVHAAQDHLDQAIAFQKRAIENADPRLKPNMQRMLTEYESRKQ